MELAVEIERVAFVGGDVQPRDGVGLDAKPQTEREHGRHAAVRVGVADPLCGPIARAPAKARAIRARVGGQQSSSHRPNSNDDDGPRAVDDVPY